MELGILIREHDQLRQAARLPHGAMTYQDQPQSPVWVAATPNDSIRKHAERAGFELHLEDRNSSVVAWIADEIDGNSCQ
jgi:hypothetical protein